MQDKFNKIGVNSATFSSLTPEKLIEELVNCGYRGVEWRVADKSHISKNLKFSECQNHLCTIPPDIKAIEHITALCQQANIEIYGLSPYIAVGDLDYCKKMLELAHIANQSRVRIWAPFIDNNHTYQQSHARLVNFIDTVLPFAQALNVQLALEIHQRTICSSPCLAMRVAENYSEDSLGLIYDMGNLAIEGLENVQLSLDLMGNYLTHVQIKNVGYRPLAQHAGWKWYWETIENGVLPIPTMLTTIMENNFTDWLSIEDFSTYRTDTEKLKHNIQLIRSYLDNNFSVTHNQGGQHDK